MESERGRAEPVRELRLEGIVLFVIGGVLVACLAGAFFLGRWYERQSAQVYVEGKIKTDKYQDKETGQDRYSVNIVANEMQMLGSRGGGSINSVGEMDYDQSAPDDDSTGKAVEKPAAVADDFDDDIPF